MYSKVIQLYLYLYICKHIYIFFFRFFSIIGYYMIFFKLHDIEQSSLCCIVGPCCYLFYVQQCVSVNAQLLIYPFFPFPPLVTISLFSVSVTTILKRNLESCLVIMHFHFSKKIKIWYMCVEQRKRMTIYQIVPVLFCLWGLVGLEGSGYFRHFIFLN